jgi:hypothetical protein
MVDKVQIQVTLHSCGNKKDIANINDKQGMRTTFSGCVNPTRGRIKLRRFGIVLLFVVEHPKDEKVDANAK